MIYRVIVGGPRPITLEVEMADGLEPPASILAQMGAAAGLTTPTALPTAAHGNNHGRLMGSKLNHPTDQAISSEDMYGG